MATQATVPATAATTSRRGSLAETVRLASRQVDYWATVYRRTWQGSAVSSFLMPLLYLAAMGVGLGTFIDSDRALQALGAAPSYLAFIAPGLLAATTMQTAVFESAYPVLGNFKWTKMYQSMVATPLSPPSVLLAHLAYVVFRIATTAAVFLVVVAAFGLVSSVVGGLAALVVATVVGLAHATPVFAYSASIKDESSFSVLFRLGVIPMFLFSGAFFPVQQLPDVMEWLAYLTPLWHGVELTRGLVLGAVDPGWAAVHLGYLLAVLVVGWWLALRAFRRRLAD
ncbi:MAG: ABC transporter permease [Actinomycetota bacterium]|nr:ABC transporter permease [Actinomycetota bacterium]